MKLAYRHEPIPKLVYDKQEFDLISISIDIIHGRLLFILASLVVSIQLVETVTITPVVCTPASIAVLIMPHGNRCWSSNGQAHIDGDKNNCACCGKVAAYKAMKVKSEAPPTEVGQMKKPPKKRRLFISRNFVCWRQLAE
jgi:hypothetical protein